MTNEVLVAVPLFVFMGAVLERSKIAEALLETMGQLFGSVRGGLAVAVVIVGALLAASTEVVGATVVTMGMLSLPAMMRAGYDPKLATGVIAASGTLGQIIPPSIILIFVGDLLMGANQLAASRRGVAVEPVSVGDLFAGAFLPGISLVVLYIAYILIHALVRPQSCPALVMSAEERASLGRRVRPRVGPAPAADRRGARLHPVRLRDTDRGPRRSAPSAPWRSRRSIAVLSCAMLVEVMRNTAVISALGVRHRAWRCRCSPWCFVAWAVSISSRTSF